MNGITKSILLQVAFKEAVTSTNAQGSYTDADVKARTKDFFNLLTELHGELNIDADEGRKSFGGGGGSKPRSAPRQSSGSTWERPNSATKIIVKGDVWYDYRDAKTKGDVKPGFPDFKSEDGKESIYMYDLEGNANPDAQPYVEAGDAFANLEVI